MVPWLKCQAISVTLLLPASIYVSIFSKHRFLSYFYHSTSNVLFWSELWGQHKTVRTDFSDAVFFFFHLCEIVLMTRGEKHALRTPFMCRLFSSLLSSCSSHWEGPPLLSPPHIQVLLTFQITLKTVLMTLLPLISKEPIPHKHLKNCGRPMVCFCSWRISILSCNLWRLSCIHRM